MENLLQLQSEIARLQKQADEIRFRDRDKTVADILGTMQAYGITVKQLQSKPVKTGKRGRPAKNVKAEKPVAEKKARVPVAAKYKGPNEELWSGRGLTPKWMKALLEGGATKESFLIS